MASNSQVRESTLVPKIGSLPSSRGKAFECPLVCSFDFTNCSDFFCLAIIQGCVCVDEMPGRALGNTLPNTILKSQFVFFVSVRFRLFCYFLECFGSSPCCSLSLSGGARRQGQMSIYPRLDQTLNLSESAILVTLTAGQKRASLWCTSSREECGSIAWRGLA